MERCESSEGEAVANTGGHGAIPDLIEVFLAGTRLLRAVIGILVLDIPVGGEVGADPSADTEHVIKLQRVVELGVLPKAAQQQRSRLLCRGRSAEEQGRHCADGPTSSQHVNYLFLVVDTATSTGSSSLRLPSGRMYAGNRSTPVMRSRWSPQNLATFPRHASGSERIFTIGTYRFFPMQTYERQLVEWFAYLRLMAPAPACKIRATLL